MAEKVAEKAPKQLSVALAAFVQATAGAGGGVWSMAMLYPIDTLKTLIQAGKTKSPSAMGAFKEIVDDGGPMALYAGLAARSLETAAKNFAYFYWYEVLYKMAATPGEQMSTFKNLTIGYWAGVANMCITMPLEVIATRTQISNVSFTDACKELNAKGGLTAYYTGFKWNALLCLNPAIVNTVFDIIKGRALDRKPKGSQFLTPLEAFALGAFAKCIATVLTYPIVRWKTILQSGISKENEGREESFFTKYFRGLAPALSKTAIQAALMYMAKEKIAAITQMLIFSAVHLLRRSPNRRHKIKALGGKPLA